MPRPAVVYVHGIRTSRTMWRAQQEMLGAAGYATLAVDLPGHGTRSDEAFTVEASAEAIGAAVASLPAPHVVVGLSLGAYLSLHWAARTAAPPAAVIAASCCTRPRGVGLAAYRAAAAAIGRLPDAGRRLNDLMVRLALPATAAADVGAGGVALDVMVPALRAMAAVDPVADLRRIESPVWLVNGAWDHFRLEERRFVAAAQHGRLVVLPKARHLVALDQPEAFARVTRLVLRQVENTC